MTDNLTATPPTYPTPTTTPLGEGQPSSRPRPVWYRRPVPLWSLIVGAGVAVFIIAAVVAGAGNKSELDKTKKDLAAARADVSSQAASASAARNDANSQSSMASAAQADASRASSSASSAVDQAKADLASSQSVVAASQAAVDAGNASLSSASGAFDAQVQARHATEFGDGTFEVGRDIQSGKYHTEGGSGCYWEKNKGGSGIGDIIDNDNASGPITLIIDSPYFKSDDCGTWTRVG